MTGSGERATTRLDDLYQRHAPGAVSFAYLLTGDRHQAEDLVQEAFVRLAGRFDHIRHVDAFHAYLRRAVTNLHTSRLRRLRLERRHLGRERAVPPPTSFQPDIESREDVWRALKVLPPRQRAALVLRFYEDLSERETAEIMRCSIAAAKSLVARGMEALRARMGGGR